MRARAVAWRALTVLVGLVLMGHSPYRQWAIYRESHLVVVADGAAPGAFAVSEAVAGALREAGVPALAKVTGTAPRLILPDGSERAIVRRAPPSIREQGWLVRRAAREGARAVVVECMAIRPELQWISEHGMVHATVGVITNARLDHTDVMGRTRDEIAQSLANSIPHRGVLVMGDEDLAGLVSARCAAAGTRLVVADKGHMGRAGSFDSRTVGLLAQGRQAEPSDLEWMRENIATALATTRELGIDDSIALRGMLKATPDPGAAAGGVRTRDHRGGWVMVPRRAVPVALYRMPPGHYKHWRKEQEKAERKAWKEQDKADRKAWKEYEKAGKKGHKRDRD